jgi:hypothetical protein
MENIISFYKLMLIVSVVAILILIYGTVRRCYLNIDDPLMKTLFNEKYKNYLDGWGLSHVIFYALLTQLYPQYWLSISIIGILWEITEHILRTNIVYMYKCHLNPDTNVDEWWYGRWQDIVMNTIGQILGFSFKKYGVSLIIYPILYVLLFVSHILI